MMKCGECMAFVLVVERFGRGECHRHAPSPGQRDDVLFPKVERTTAGCMEGMLSAIHQGTVKEPEAKTDNEMAAQQPPVPKIPEPKIGDLTAVGKLATTKPTTADPDEKW